MGSGWVLRRFGCGVSICHSLSFRDTFGDTLQDIFCHPPQNRPFLVCWLLVGCLLARQPKTVADLRIWRGSSTSCRAREILMPIHAWPLAIKLPARREAPVRVICFAQPISLRHDENDSQIDPSYHAAQPLDRRVDADID